MIAMAATVSVIAAFTNAARVCGPSTPSTNTQVPAATATAMTAAMPRAPRNTAERGNASASTATTTSRIGGTIAMA